MHNSIFEYSNLRKMQMVENVEIAIAYMRPVCVPRVVCNYIRATRAT